jgi:hypothetical protein
MKAMYDDPRAPLTQTTTYWGQVLGHADSTQWLIQAGITKNWTGFGNTALYAEFAKNTDWGAGIGTGRNFSAATIPGAVSVNGVVDTSMDVWGLGLTQNLDAAATELYLGWRHFSPEITCTGAATAAGACAGAAGGVAKRLGTEDFDAVIGGARVKF